LSENGIYFYIRGIIKNTHKIADMELIHLGLGHVEGRVLLMIYQCKTGCSQEELSSKFDIDRSNVGRALKRLESLRYIEKKKDEEDGRAFKIYLTEKGLGIRDYLLNMDDTLNKTLMKEISFSDFDFLLKIVKKMNNNLKKENFDKMKTSK